MPHRTPKTFASILLLIAGMLFFLGCLKDGIPKHTPDEYQLALVPSATEVNPGESVSFDIWLLDEIVEADLFINNQKISGTTYRFMEQGVYDVYAQKEGVKNSDTLQITVGDATVVNQLQLLVAEITEDDETGDKLYVFDVKANGGSITDAEIYVDNEKISDYTHRFAPREESYTVFAHKDGYLNSDTLEITINPPSVLSKLELLVTGVAEQIETGIKIYFFDVKADGASISDAEIYVDNEKIPEYQHHFIPRAEPYKVFASKDGYLNSDTMQITIAQPPRYKLFITASRQEISVGETVTFQTGYVNVEPILTDADIYINGSKISGKTHTFNQAGNYSVVAKKQGYDESDPITITVKEQQQEPSPVFVSGFEGEGGSAQAKLWRGSAAQVTTLGNGYATDMFNFYGSLYISGYVSNETANNYTAKYWNHFPDDRTTQETVLHTGKAYANSIFVEPADGGVLVGGSIGQNPAYWLWGEATTLDSDGDAVVKGAGYHQGQVYAVGKTVQAGKPEATIWALGDRWGLSGGKESEANAIAMQNGDYYVAGWVREGQAQRAVYWRDNGAHLLPGDGMAVEATDISVKNNKVYVVGNLMNFSERHLAVLWINNTMYTLNEMPDRHAFAHSVAVGNDGTIYVAGSVQEWLSDNRTAVYWQVGPSGNVMKTVRLTDGSKDAAATGIVLNN